MPGIRACVAAFKARNCTRSTCEMCYRLLWRGTQLHPQHVWDVLQAAVAWHATAPAARVRCSTGCCDVARNCTLLNCYSNRHTHTTMSRGYTHSHTPHTISRGYTHSHTPHTMSRGYTHSHTPHTMSRSHTPHPMSRSLFAQPHTSHLCEWAAVTRTVTHITQCHAAHSHSRDLCRYHTSLREKVRSICQCYSCVDGLIYILYTHWVYQYRIS